MTPEVFIWGCPGEYGAYRAAVTRAGGRSRLSRDLSAADGCCALLLPGGGDLEPWRYGQPDTACRGTDPARDAAELTLLERFTGAGKPILGICRGLQVINVFFGGTLVQDLPGHSQTGGTDRLHRVRSASSPLRELWGDAPVVNSAHHQAADRLGTDLRAVQWAPDGTVEALLHGRLPVWAVQYHPERLTGAGTADGDRLFAAWLALAVRER